MLEVINIESVDKLIDETVPQNIRLKKQIELDQPMSEQEYLEHIQFLGKKIKFSNPTLEWDIIRVIYQL